MWWKKKKNQSNDDVEVSEKLHEAPTIEEDPEGVSNDRSVSAVIRAQCVFPVRQPEEQHRVANQKQSPNM